MSASPSPTLEFVTCASPHGLHRLAYWSWGDPANPRVIICAHGLTRTGRDFDTLAAALAADARVICPDMIGRGRSDWVKPPELYNLPQYVADCVTLVARLNVPKVTWVGTSMGGLIGMVLASLGKTPIGRLVLNDVGPVVATGGLDRIGDNVGTDPSFDTFEAGVAQSRAWSRGFGPLTDEQWRQLNAHYVVQRADGRWHFHYDPSLAIPYRAAMAASIAPLWPIYDAIGCPTLITRGAQSDILLPDTAAEMRRRGPKAELIEFAGVGHAPVFMTADQIEPVREFLFR